VTPSVEQSSLAYTVGRSGQKEQKKTEETEIELSSILSISSCSSFRISAAACNCRSVSLEFTITKQIMGCFDLRYTLGFLGAKFHTILTAQYPD